MGSCLCKGKRRQRDDDADVDVIESIESVEDSNSPHSDRDEIQRILDFDPTVTHVDDADRSSISSDVDLESFNFSLHSKSTKQENHMSEISTIQSTWTGVSKQTPVQSISTSTTDGKSSANPPTTTPTKKGKKVILAELKQSVTGNMENATSTASRSDNDRDVTGTAVTGTDTDHDVTSKHKYRHRLPAANKEANISIWAILKQTIGKDLSRIAMPIQINEPLSLLQRLAEYMEYCTLIDQAVRASSPVARMEYVCAFAVATLSSAYKRMKKPFNPLLGETYEYVRPDMGFRLVAEQVSHHPPVSAFHAEGKGYTFQGTIQPQVKFSGFTVDISPMGTVYLYLKKHKETYSWHFVDCVVRNIFMGKMWLENKGVQVVVCPESNLKGILTFKHCDWAGEHHHVEGHIFNDKEVAMSAIYGSWVKGLYRSTFSELEKFLSDKKRKTAYQKKRRPSRRASQIHATPSVLSFNFMLPDQKTLWTPNRKSASCSQYYLMTKFAMTLNELILNQDTILPPTDSRFRADIRLMENGQIEEAGEEKAKIEENQRKKRKANATQGVEHRAKWFVSTETRDDEEVWQFTNMYWKREWMPDGEEKKNTEMPGMPKFTESLSQIANEMLYKMLPLGSQ